MKYEIKKPKNECDPTTIVITVPIYSISKPDILVTIETNKDEADLQPFLEIIENAENSTDLYDALDNPEPFNQGWFPFDEDEINELLSGLTPIEIIRQVFFGNIQNWNDNWIHYNAYGNLESTDHVDYDNNIHEILEQLLEENT